MGAQLELRPDWSLRWQEDRRLLRQMAEAIGLKEVAYDLDVSPSQLAHGLDERDRHLPGSWINYLVARAPAELADAFARRIASLRGLECVEPAPLKPEEELADLKTALAECLGEDLRAAILTRAKRSSSTRRRK